MKYSRRVSGRVQAVLICSLIACLSAMPIMAQDAVDDETCLLCHEGYDEQLASTTHRLSGQIDKPAIAISCVSCHTGGESHIDDPTAHNIGNPSRLTTAAARKVCSSCHQPHTEMGTVAFDPHIGQNLSCTDCHGVHAANVSLLLDDDAEFCGKCHTSVANDFRRRSVHPVNDGVVSCLSCHDFTGDAEPTMGHGASANCVTCHQELAGPFLHEHQATSSFSPEGEGCVACHMPHGSPNERLLNQPGNALCRQCHGVPAGHAVAHDGIGMMLSCLECHSAIHGSYDNSHLLDEQLGIKIGGEPNSCYCHNVGN